MSSKKAPATGVEYPPWNQMLAFKQTSPTTFETMRPPMRMGNALPIAYGGFALAAAVKAACLTLPQPSDVQPEYHLYSIVGNYLGPAKIDRPLLTKVTVVRQTRTFATRLVEVSQAVKEGEARAGEEGLTERKVMIALADFQVAEPESMPNMIYSAAPSRTYTHYSKLEDGETQAQKMAEEGKVTPKMVKMQSIAFGLAKSLFDTRPCPEGLFAQLLTGIAKHLPSTQDSLPLTQRSTADWVRARSHNAPAVANQTDNAALLSFLMDGAIAFIPLTFQHQFLDDSGATSSLEFALRVFTNEVRMGEWHLREMVTHVGAEGRTYSESRMWDEGGRCVASMTQQSIMRPKKKKKAGKL